MIALEYSVYDVSSYTAGKRIASRDIMLQYHRHTFSGSFIFHNVEAYAKYGIKCENVLTAAVMYNELPGGVDHIFHLT